MKNFKKTRTQLPKDEMTLSGPSDLESEEKRIKKFKKLLKRK